MKIWRGEGRQGGNSGPGRRRPRGRVASPGGTNRARQRTGRKLAACGRKQEKRQKAAKGGSHTGATHRTWSSPRAQRSRSLESRLLRPERLGPWISFPQEARHLPLSLDLAVGSGQQRLPVTKSSASSSGPGALKADSKQRRQPLSSDDLFFKPVGPVPYFLNQRDLRPHWPPCLTQVPSRHQTIPRLLWGGVHCS